MNKTVTLDKIRRLILLKTGIDAISPSDCKSIAFSISRETKKSISETTIKRLFAFAESKSNFSRYTLSALLEYIGEVEHQLSTAFNASPNFKEIQANCNRVTAITWRNSINRSGIPFQLTVARIFPKLDFDYFYNSAYSFMAVVSRAGYGKSTLMCHLVQQLLADGSKTKESDAILFVTARDIFDDQFEYTNLEERIKSKIGLSSHTDLAAYFSEKHQQTGAKLLIFIDSFSELLINNVSKPIIFDKLINLVCSIGQSEGIKVVFTMRSNMWNRFFDRIRSMPFMLQKWFPGLCFDIRDQSNIPPLALEEIEEILTKIDPEKSLLLPQEVKAKLKYPFFIQWYYLLKDEFPSFEPSSDLIFFEIVDRFICQKIHQSSYATEKVIFCQKLSTLTLGSKSVPKTLLIESLAHFKNAYRELLADGILMEEKQEDEGFTTEYVRFVHPHVFEYFLFLTLYHNCGKKINQHFLKEINIRYAGNSTRFQLLQWAAKIVIAKGSYPELQLLITQPMGKFEKKALIHFIAESLKYTSYRKSLPATLQSEELHQRICHELDPLDFVDSRYLDTICSLKSVSPTKEQTYLYLLVLAVYDCLSMNKQRLLQRINAMEELQANITIFSINPTALLHSILNFLSGKAAPDTVLSHKIAQFKKAGIELDKNDNKLPSQLEMVAFVLLLIRENIRDVKGVAQITDAMISYFPKLLVANTSFSAYFLAIMDFNAHRDSEIVSDHVKAKIKSKVKEMKHEQHTTQFTHSIYQLSKAYQNLNKGNYANAITLAENSLTIFKRNHLRLIEVSVYELLSELYGLIGDIEKKNDYLYQKIKSLNQQKIIPLVVEKIEK